MNYALWSEICAPFQGNPRQAVCENLEAKKNHSDSLQTHAIYHRILEKLDALSKNELEKNKCSSTFNKISSQASNLMNAAKNFWKSLWLD